MCCTFCQSLKGGKMYERYCVEKVYCETDDFGASNISHFANFSLICLKCTVLEVEVFLLHLFFCAEA